MEIPFSTSLGYAYMDAVPRQFEGKSVLHQIWLRPLTAVALLAATSLGVIETAFRIVGFVTLCIPHMFVKGIHTTPAQKFSAIYLEHFSLGAVTKSIGGIFLSLFGAIYQLAFGVA